jgi:site-specific DNA-methyltransferase (adenine-specific)
MFPVQSHPWNLGGHSVLPTPYLTTLNGVLFADDCLKVMAEMRSQSVDCVFADPPFNLGKDYRNGYHDAMDQARYLEWCETWVGECVRLLTTGGSFFIYATPELAVRFAGMLNAVGMVFRHWIALTMKGTYSRGRKLYPAHYALLYYTKGEPKVFNRLRLPIPVCRHCLQELRDYGGHRDKLNPEGLNLTDFWEDTSPNRHARFKVRPGVNELKLIIPERAIRISTDQGDVVFDPFGGGGSTYQAAEITGRRWIGTELYDCAHIQRRLAEVCPLSLGRTPLVPWQEAFRSDEDHQAAFLRRSPRESVPARAV